MCDLGRPGEQSNSGEAESGGERKKSTAQYSERNLLEHSIVPSAIVLKVSREDEGQQQSKTRRQIWRLKSKVFCSIEHHSEKYDVHGAFPSLGVEILV